MLPSKNRLVARRDFEAVKKKGQKFQSALFGLLVYPTGKDSSRFGFIISTRLSAKATKRNRTKRRLRAAVRQILPRIRAGFDIVVLGKKNILPSSLFEIQSEIEKTFGAAGLVNNGNKK